MMYKQCHVGDCMLAQTTAKDLTPSFTLPLTAAR
jgi:hypothetical protein